MGKSASRLFAGKHSFQNFQKFFRANSFSQIFVLVDENTLKYCYPVIASVLPEHKVIRIKSGEKNKAIKSCELIWSELTAANADRRAVLVNLGGGVIGDLGGFAAGCYKRGISFVNLPTTLLAMVDASVGAKTGIDFKGFKNQIGLFNDPEAIFINTGFLKTLPARELRAGFAEVIKHYLIADKREFQKTSQLFAAKDNGLINLDWDRLVRKNIAIKLKIVEKDKFESGPRKALNFGHTIGHALETFYLNKGIKVLHGEAVAMGIICESLISVQKGFLKRSDYLTILRLVGAVYPNLPVLKKQNIAAVVGFISQDKKNEAAKNRFTLLKGIGNFSVDNFVEEEVIIESLQYYSELSA